LVENSIDNPKECLSNFGWVYEDPNLSGNPEENKEKSNLTGTRKFRLTDFEVYRVDSVK
jgi:hypothetical protein